MKNTLHDILTQVRSFISGEFPGIYRFPTGFRFGRSGRLAYEIVLDASPSMEDSDYSPSRFAAAKQAAASFLQKCIEKTPDAFIGVIFYSSSARVASPLLSAKAHVEELRQAIFSGKTNEATNIGAGLILAGEELVAKGIELSPAIVLLTDGHSNIGPNPVDAAAQLKEGGIRIDVVGIGGSPSEVNESELKQIASSIDGQLRYWFIRDSGALLRKFEALALGRL